MKVVVLTKEREAARTEIQRAEAALREAVDKLHSISELDVPTALGNIVDADWLREQLGNRIALVRADKSLTAAEREQRLNPWRAIKAKAERAVSKIAFVLNDLQPLEWLPDEDGKNFHLDPKQAEEQATQKATKPVPPLAEEHWRLISAMRTAVEQLRAFETENNVKDAPLIVLSRFDEDRLYREWVTGNILIQHRVISGKDVTARKLTELYY